MHELRQAAFFCFRGRLLQIPHQPHGDAHDAGIAQLKVLGGQEARLIVRIFRLEHNHISLLAEAFQGGGLAIHQAATIWPLSAAS